MWGPPNWGGTTVSRKDKTPRGHQWGAPPMGGPIPVGETTSRKQEHMCGHILLGAPHRGATPIWGDTPHRGETPTTVYILLAPKVGRHTTGGETDDHTATQSSHIMGPNSLAATTLVGRDAVITPHSRSLCRLPTLPTIVWEARLDEQPTRPQSDGIIITPPLLFKLRARTLLPAFLWRTHRTHFLCGARHLTMLSAQRAKKTTHGRGA